MLKFTGVETGLVCDQDMYEMMDAGLRGGMTQTAWKKVAANNTYMETDYDKNQEISCNNYLFRCNVYFNIQSSYMIYVIIASWLRKWRMFRQICYQGSK